MAKYAFKLTPTPDALVIRWLHNEHDVVELRSLVYTNCRKRLEHESAEDVTQTVLADVRKKKRRILGIVERKESPGWYVTRIIHNRILQCWDKESREQAFLVGRDKQDEPNSHFYEEPDQPYDDVADTVAEIPTPKNDPLLASALAQAMEMFWEIYDQAKGARKRDLVAIQLRYLKQLPFCEVAQTMDEPLNTVKSRVRTGMKYLRQQYQKRSYGPEDLCFR